MSNKSTLHLPSKKPADRIDDCAFPNQAADLQRILEENKTTSYYVGKNSLIPDSAKEFHRYTFGKVGISDRMAWYFTESINRMATEKAGKPVIVLTIHEVIAGRIKDKCPKTPDK